MGGSGGFNKAISTFKHHRPPDQSVQTFYQQRLRTNDLVIVIDMSVLLYVVQKTSALGARMFLGESNLVDSYVRAIAKYLDVLMALSGTIKFVFVFEKGMGINSQRAPKLNNAFKSIYYKENRKSVRIGKQQISRNSPLPKPSMQEDIATALVALYPNATIECHFATDKSDYLIFQLANCWQHDNLFVYSVDYDYLVYSDQIRGVITPRLKKTFIIEREEILNGLKVSSEELKWAYAAAGCDDLKPGLKNVGFKTALSVCKNGPLIDASNRLRRVSSTEKRALVNRLRVFLDKLSLVANMENPFPKQVTNSTSYAHEFVFNQTANGNRRRLHFLAFDENAEHQIRCTKVFPPKPEISKKKRKELERAHRESINAHKAQHCIEVEFDFVNPTLSQIPAAQSSSRSTRPKRKGRSKRQQSGDDSVPKPARKKRSKSQRFQQQDVETIPNPPEAEPSTSHQEVVQKRSVSEASKDMNLLKSLHMACTRTVGTVSSLTKYSAISQEFGLHLKNICIIYKVLLY